MPATLESAVASRARFEVLLDRHEAKYVIPRTLVPEIRAFIAPFCDPDHNGQGTPPEYTITTLQFDTPDYALHLAKPREANERFKLRARTYGMPGENPVFVEIKRKLRGTIVKSRTAVPFTRWNEAFVMGASLPAFFKTRAEEESFLLFRRLVRELGARPVMLIRYIRESYFGRMDRYARVTFDRRLEYQPTSAWDEWGCGGRWRPMDSSVTQNKGLSLSGVVLELKTLNEAPVWMLDLVREFDLVRTGHCKYSNAVWEESFFAGEPAPPAYADAWANDDDREVATREPWMIF